MGKRVFLFLATNLLIVLTLSVVMSLLKIGGYMGPGGQIQITQLAIFCLIWGMGASLISLAMSRWIAKQSVGVKLVNGATGQPELDRLYRTVERLSRDAGLPKTPEVGFYESPEVNAFATGPSKSMSLVAVSTGLLQGMSEPEIEGVLGHEIAHIANGDMVTMTLLQGVINAFVMFFARIAAFAARRFVDERIAGVVSFVVLIVFQIGFGILGSMVTAWFSRYREFRADAGGAKFAGRDKMVAALRRLQQNQEQIDGSHPALATLKISDRRGMKLFSTHPPLEDRIAALQSQPVF